MTATARQREGLDRIDEQQHVDGAASSPCELSRHGGFIHVPIVGCIAAGPREPSEQQDLGTVPVDAVSAGLKKHSRMFAVKVRGDSMSGAQINDGDLVILEQRPPKNGDIVAALIDGETTLKRYITTRGRPFLKAENPKYPDIHPVEELTIQGVMVALVRRSRR